jgi:hypothetical protein
MTLRNVARQATRMSQMMHRLNVNTLKVACVREGQAYVQARLTCFDCAIAAHCLDWLDAAPGDAQPTFCPNLPLFVQCRMDSGRAPHD